MSDPIAHRGMAPAAGETERERLNRNFNELLQELRVLQTGVQILFAFMLTLPFAAGFDRLDDTQRDVYGVALLLVGGAMAFLIGPVAAHRATFRRRLKPHVIFIAHYMMIIGMGLLLVAVLCAVEVAAWAALGDTWTTWVTAVVATLFVGCWVVVPVLLRVGPFAPEPDPARGPIKDHELDDADRRGADDAAEPAGR